MWLPPAMPTRLNLVWLQTLHGRATNAAFAVMGLKNDARLAGVGHGRLDLRQFDPALLWGLLVVFHVGMGL